MKSPTVRFLKPTVFRRRERDTTPWQNDSYAVKPLNGMWTYYRKKDGIQMTTKLFSTWQQAQQACIAEQGAVRMA